MSTQTQGIGRQRYDFTDADVSVTGVQATTGGQATPGGGGGGSNLVQSVEIVDAQFKLLMAGIADPKTIADTQFTHLIAVLDSIAVNTAGTGSSKKTQTVRVVDVQFQALMGSLRMLISRAGGGPSQTKIPYRDAATLVELVDEQFQKLVAAAGSAKKAIPPNMGGAAQGRTGDGFWSNFGNVFKQATRLTSPKGLRAGRRAQKRAGLDLVKRGRSLSAKGGPLAKIGGKAMQMAGGLAMKAAGPLAIAEVVAQVVASGFKMASSAVKLFGEVAVKAAGNDGIGILTTGLNAASESLGKIPIVGQVFAAGLDLATAGLNTFQSVLKAFTARGRELARYNPRIAMAAATADVRKIFADIREANAGADKYAKLILKQQDIEEKFQRALQPFKDAVMDVLLKMAPTLEVLAPIVGDLLVTSVKNGVSILEVFQTVFLPGMGAMVKNGDKLVTLAEEEKARELEEIAARSAFPNMLFNAVDAIKLENFVDPVDNRGGNKLNFPIKMGP